MLNKKIQITEILKSMDEKELLALYNRYCERMSDWDGLIYKMTEFNDMMDGYNPLRLADSICYGKFSVWHTYFKFNGRGNLESFDNLDGVIDIDDLVDYIINNDESFGNAEIQSILERFETEEMD